MGYAEERHGHPAGAQRHRRLQISTGRNLPAASEQENFVEDAQMLGEAVAASLMGIAHARSHADYLGFDATARTLFQLGGSDSWRGVFRRLDHAGKRWLLDAFKQARNGATAIAPATFRLTGDDGKLRWIKCSAKISVSHCAGGCWIAPMFDVTADQRELETLRQQEEHLRFTVEMNPELPWIADPNGKVLEFTDRWLNATGLTAETAGDQGWMSVCHPDDVMMVSSSIAELVSNGTPFDVRCRIRLVGIGYRWMRARGFPRRDARGHIVRWYGYTEDIHEHVLVEQKIRWTAEHDALTGLPNRMLFNRRLETAIDQALQRLSRVGLLILDVDQFKEVNDLLGHDAGDALLRHFAQKLLLSLPDLATIARIGGDEFAVLIPDITSPQDITRHCDRIFEVLKEPFRFAGHNVECRTSIGATLYPDHGQRSSELMKHADLALYSAKSAGRGRLMVFELSMHDEMRHRVAMLNRARAAVEENTIFPYYQPKVSMITGKIIGFEALLRWRDRRGRIFTPATISAAFDELDIAEAMGEAMFDRILRDMMLWRGMGLQYGHIAINAAPAEFRRNILAKRVIDRLELTGIPPHELQLEVTEGVFLGRGAEYAKRTIRELHDYGINIALDDFGTGFASLSHLRQFPVDTLKIDRSFVSEVAYLSDDAAIVAAIVSLGKNLGMKVVAEGVETPEQAAALHAQGCEYAQGFLYCRPIPSESVPDLLTNWQTDQHWTQRPKRNRDVAAA